MQLPLSPYHPIVLTPWLLAADPIEEVRQFQSSNGVILHDFESWVRRRATSTRGQVVLRPQHVVLRRPCLHTLDDPGRESRRGLPQLRRPGVVHALFAADGAIVVGTVT